MSLEVNLPTVIAVATLVLAVLPGGFYMGRLTNRVANNEDQLKRMEKAHERLEKSFSEFAVELRTALVTIATNQGKCVERDTE